MKNLKTMPMAPIGGGGTKTCRYRSVTSYSVTDFIQSRVQRLTERFTYLWSVRLCISNAFMTTTLLTYSKLTISAINLVIFL